MKIKFEGKKNIWEKIPIRFNRIDYKMPTSTSRESERERGKEREEKENKNNSSLWVARLWIFQKIIII